MTHRRLYPVLALIATMAFTTPPEAVAQEGIRWSVGGRVAGSVSDAYGSDAEAFRQKPGGGIGAFATAEMTEQFALRGELWWQRKGAENKQTGERIALDYIELPALAVALIPAGDVARITPFAGFALAFRVGASREGTDIKDFTKPVDFGTVLGIGWEFLLGAVDAVFDIRWTIGFVRVDDTSQEANVRNSNVSAIAGISVPLGR